MIIPSKSSELSWAENKIVPAPIHARMLVQKKIFHDIAARLDCTVRAGYGAEPVVEAK